MDIKYYNNKNIRTICMLLVVSMLLAGIVAKDNIISTYDCKSVNRGTPSISAVYGGDFNTEICTIEMLGVRNVAYISNNSKRTYSEAAIRISAIILYVQNYLHSISEMSTGLRWEVTPQMHSDIFILDFIHRQDGEK